MIMTTIPMNRFCGAADAVLALFDEHGALPKYAWPGGYDITYCDGDGDALCGDCATKTLLRNIDLATSTHVDRTTDFPDIIDREDLLIGYDVGHYGPDEPGECAACLKALG